MKRLIILGALLMGLHRVGAESDVVRMTPNPTPSPLEIAQSLAQDGQDEEAFTRFLAIPGAEQLAVALARPQAAHYLEVVRADQTAPEVSRRIVEGDLLLALRRRDEALAAYRAAFAALQEAAQSDLKQNCLPRRPYAAEFSPRGAAQREEIGAAFEVPWHHGCGSHRDNWLLRRFIGMGAWADAASEFARVWAIHCDLARPYVYEQDFYSIEQKTTVHGRLLYHPAGFDNRGREFAIDYAYFLKRQARPQDAFAILLRVVLAMDLEPEVQRVTELHEGDHPTEPARPDWPPKDWRREQGFTEQDFLRLAYGACKSLKREDELCAALQTSIAQGDNRKRLTLAALRLHAGDSNAAQQLELDYVAHSGFSPARAALRRGLIYDEFRKLPEAVAAFEDVSRLPYSTPAAPDRPFARRVLVANALEHLESLYAALGQRDKSLDVILQQLDERNSRDSLDAYEDAARRFRAAGQEARFQAWAKARLTTAKSPSERARLAWVCDDKAAALASVTQAVADPQFRKEEVGTWIWRFKEVPGAQKTLLEAVLKAEPDNVETRLAWLDLTKAPLAERAPTLEKWLAAQKTPWREDLNSERPFTVAAQLLRFYLRSGRHAEAQTLGLLLARYAGPYREGDSQFDYAREDNSLRDRVEIMLAQVIAQANDNDLTELAAALESSAFEGARAQIARRRAGKLIGEPARDFGWANAPAGVRVLAGNGDVCALCRDDKYIYAGQPWGVAVYDFDLHPVTRIALGETIEHLAVCGGFLWCGSRNDLFRLDPRSWTAVRVGLGPKDENNNDNYLNGMAAKEGVLWLSTNADLRSLDVGAHTLRVLTPPSGRLNSLPYGGVIFEGPFVWVNGNDECVRYDPRSGDWRQPKADNKKQVRLLGEADGQLWGESDGHVCLIDRVTLQVTPLPFAGGWRGDSGFSIFGHSKGRLIFGTNYPSLAYDPVARQLRLVVDEWGTLNAPLETPFPMGQDRPKWWQRPDGAWQNDGVTTLLTLPDGRRVAGARLAIAEHEWPFGASVQEVHEYAGGLSVFPQQGATEPLRPDKATAKEEAVRPVDENFADVLRGSKVLSAAPDGKGHLWLGTNYGVCVLDEAGRVRANLSRRDGLESNRVSGVAALGDKLYFAARHEDNAGGLMILDPNSGVFTTRTQADGLAANSVERLAAENGALRLTYGAQYRRDGDLKYQQFPPGVYDPAKDSFSASGEPKTYTNEDSVPIGPSLGIMPILGGTIIARVPWSGGTLLCGTRGALWLKDEKSAALPIAALPPRAAEDPRIALLKDAQQRPVKIASVAQLARALKDANPLYRANALASLLAQPKLLNDPASAPLIQSQLDDPEPRVRGTALYLAVETQNDLTPIVLLQKRLADEVPALRVAAAIGLCRRGTLPDIKLLRAMLQTNQLGIPFGADDSRAFEGDEWPLLVALAPRATPEIFALFLESPQRYSLDEDPWPKIISDLGASLRARPESAQVLLHAYDAAPHDPWQIPFAQLVFRQAGKPILPQLHAALRSPERVVRSNAARACGAIGDKSSIGPLLAALDLESGLSRASIVWALGELKAREALPKLAQLYTAAHRAESHPPSTIFGPRTSRMLMNNVAAEAANAYAALRDIDAVGGDWDELKDAAAGAPLEPERNETLLASSDVMAAVRHIGPQFAQEFYRQLAGSDDFEMVVEAARCLAQPGTGTAGQIELRKNLPVLRTLLASQIDQARIAAAVSLLLLGQKDAQKPILDELKGTYAFLMFREWGVRIRDAHMLEFARAQLTAMAREASPDPQRREAHEGAQRWLQRLNSTLAPRKSP